MFWLSKKTTEKSHLLVPYSRLHRSALTNALAVLIGILAGFGAVLFTYLIHFVTRFTVEPFLSLSRENTLWLIGLCMVPALGLLTVSWFTRRFAPEAQGHGVPEVILAVTRHDGVIRPRVSIVKIIASCVCIGTGGSIGREGPIVQIGSSLGSMAAQLFHLSPRNVKVLVAAGAAAGISATFHAPLAGVMFASEIILGSFAVESLTPIVIASVLADVVQTHSGEHGFQPAFPGISHVYQGAWMELPSYFLLGLVCGLAAVAFTKLLYWIEEVAERRLARWWLRALVLGGIVGLAGALYPMLPPSVAGQESQNQTASAGDGEELPMPPLFGVGYEVVDHALHLESQSKTQGTGSLDEVGLKPTLQTESESKLMRLDPSQLLAEFWWLLPLAFLKPIMTCVTLGGGGSGGIFAPSLFLGATLGASFGIIANLLLPDSMSANPGLYAIIGMGAAVAGTTHGTLSAILIVYEMTHDYRIILPIMIAAGLAGLVARFIDPESIYEKKLCRREETTARGHDMHRFEHIMVRDIMIRHFPTVKPGDDLTEIIRVARANPHIECLPVMNDAGKLIGIIRPGDLDRVFD
ncbi:MAG: chloride channel protein, partial [Planctomycetota bacterium]|nr:chloride channel protein [Planctomycetota bacterium]